MRFPSILSALAVLAALVIYHPHIRTPERNLGSHDLEAIADLLRRDVEDIATESARTQAPATHPQSEHRQTQRHTAPATQRETQRPTERPQSTQRPQSTERPQSTQRPQSTERPTERPTERSTDRPQSTQRPQSTPEHSRETSRETFTAPTSTEPQSTPEHSRETSRETFTASTQPFSYTDTRTNPRQSQSYTSREPTHTEPHYTPPVTSYSPPIQTYTPPYTTYTSVYNPAPPPEHRTHHRSENGYTTIYISVGNRTTYYQPIYVQPTYYAPPPPITYAPDPVIYTTVYVYPDSNSNSQTYYETVTTYVSPSQQTSTTYIYQTYVAPPASTATAQSGLGAEPTQGVNPWAGSCPIPSEFVISNFVSGSGGVSLSISYNGGTFKCPNTPYNEVIYNGMNDMYCDDDGLVRVITDGSSWLWISEWSWCNAVPATSGNMPTLEASTNYTNFGYYALDCTTGTTGKQTCKQAVQDFSIPVVSYSLRGTIRFEPLDINGNYLPGCPSATNVQPIVTKTATCASVQAQNKGLTTVTIIA
ncbi:uncharacterized protein PAC_07957 [Phialocephala subalpina]|uniref:Uncharacterized protein n=1 Tax=Phialocephala subalpina TaxID=576137 RepID=A0A1L7WZ64_9HELO|nr:uncharacterized protein PAC_07957 [Phialocephala subalpina]